MIYCLLKSSNLEQIKVGDATRFTVKSVQALIERGKRNRAA